MAIKIIQNMKAIYKPSQCMDLNDCDNALAIVNDLISSEHNKKVIDDKFLMALVRRKNNLLKRRAKFQKP